MLVVPTEPNNHFLLQLQVKHVFLCPFLSTAFYEAERIKGFSVLPSALRISRKAAAATAKHNETTPILADRADATAEQGPNWTVRRHSPVGGAPAGPRRPQRETARRRRDGGRRRQQEG